MPTLTSAEVGVTIVAAVAAAWAADVNAVADLPHSIHSFAE